MKQLPYPPGGCFKAEQRLKKGKADSRKSLEWGIQTSPSTLLFDAALV